MMLKNESYTKQGHRSTMSWQQFPVKVINQRNLICYYEDPTEQQNWKIFIPDSLIQDVLRWYHLI